jgi:hypothetical protein
MRAGALVGLAACGALLAVAAAALLPPAPEALAEPSHVRWSLAQRDLAEGGQYLKQGEPWVGHVVVGRAYVRELRANLTWHDDQPGSAPDTFTLELSPPAPLPSYEQLEGGDGALVQRYTVFAQPPLQPGTLGRGTWTVRVYLKDAGDGTTLGVLPGLPDDGNDFHLRVDMDAWVPG